MPHFIVKEGSLRYNGKRYLQGETLEMNEKDVSGLEDILIPSELGGIKTELGKPKSKPGKPNPELDNENGSPEIS